MTTRRKPAKKAKATKKAAKKSTKKAAKSTKKAAKSTKKAAKGPIRRSPRAALSVVTRLEADGKATSGRSRGRGDGVL